VFRHFPAFKLRGRFNGLTIPRFSRRWIWIFAHGPDDIEFSQHILRAIALPLRLKSSILKKLTKPGSDLRHFKMAVRQRCITRKMNWPHRALTGSGMVIKKIIDGSPKPSYSEVQSWTLNALKPAHYTTEEDGNTSKSYGARNLYAAVRSCTGGCQYRR